ncbi:SDR family NAD(P)-dependent oxidoreductase [Paraburkholderia tropica]|uniref:SDR family NAD(P)-dependent oxidoreductase n=1 Tax=Paraburkholderia tropica TaxID=92647 RepID=UPI002AB2BCA7|nr:SDR family NAD(P)-dependent oxidoreductase [Paraburkholderia tropica]
MYAHPKLPSFRLDGKTALVTGASRGIGMACASALAQAGARVTVAARSRLDLELVCRAIASAGGDAQALILDVTDSERVNSAVIERGPFNILVNSAGCNNPRPMVDVEDRDIDEILTLNVKSTFYMCRAVARGLLQVGQSGSIINISSQMGHVGSHGRTVYCASKHAIEGMTKSLAWELGPQQIRVNTVCPTFIETALTEEMFKRPGFREWVTSKIALNRVGQIEEVMGAIVFLASDASSLMTGSALMLDGGWTAA